MGAFSSTGRLPKVSQVRKRFFFPPTSEKKDKFVVEMDVDFRNDGVDVYTNAGYFISLGSTQPLHPSDMTVVHSAGLVHRGAQPKATGSDLVRRAELPVRWSPKTRGAAVFQERVNGADWAAMSNQFFTTIMTPLTREGDGGLGAALRGQAADGANLAGIEGAMKLPGFESATGANEHAAVPALHRPKLYGRLAKLQHDEAEIMNFGWFKWSARFSSIS